MTKKKKTTRMCLFPQDIMSLTGKSYRASLTLMQKIRESFAKPKGAFITISEFAIYSGIDEEEVIAFIQ